MILPEIRIKKSFLLNNKVVPLLIPELESQGRLPESDDEYIDNKVTEYQQAWLPYEETIIRSMCEILEVEFYQNTIDVYVAPFANSFSDPMVVSTKYNGERFVEIMTHEILHRLFTDNNRLPLKNGDKLLPYWKDLFGQEHSFVTLVHIPVNAVLQYILIDVLHEPERLERDIRYSGRGGDYDKAWKYVQEHDYKKIIDKVKDIYAQYSSK